MIRFLLWFGFIRRRDNGKIRWPFHAAPWHCWRSFARHPVGMTRCNGAFYTFRNLPGVIKWEKGRLLPRRWGFGLFGLLEFGDRG